MIVWIVSEHWHYETGDVREVFDSKEKDIAMVTKELKGRKNFHLESDFEDKMIWTDNRSESWQIERWTVA